jgi:hypothetical protein
MKIKDFIDWLEKEVTWCEENEIKALYVFGLGHPMYARAHEKLKQTKIIMLNAKMYLDFTKEEIENEAGGGL